MKSKINYFLFSPDILRGCEEGGEERRAQERGRHREGVGYNAVRLREKDPPEVKV